jgi:fatty-acyl-CoA synthase
MESIGRWLDALADEHGARPALISHERQVSYRELAAAAWRVAASLAAIGVAKGTRVGVLVPNRAEWLECVFGALRLGALVVPLNTLWRAAELEYALRHADVAVLLLVPRFLNHDYAAIVRALCPELEHATAFLTASRLPALRRLVTVGGEPVPGMTPLDTLLHAAAPGPDPWLAAVQAQVVATDEATVFFTSGSTAAPKGVVHTHAGMLQAAANVADRLGLGADDRTWGYLPFFFTGGCVAVGMATLSRGGAVLLQEVFDAGAALRLMAEHRCTTFFAWPHQADALVNHPDFARTTLRLRKGPGANAPWAERLFLPGHQAVGTWGMTETGPMAACSRHDEPLAVRAGAHGRAMPGLELRVVDPESGAPLPTGTEGELVVRGNALMAHYYKMTPSECFDAEGFFHTGDLARLDAGGLLHFRGRIKDVIKTAGVNVAAAEVEAVLLEHPGVRVAVVTGVPHPTRGENVVAFVVPQGDAGDAAALLDFCRTRLAAYKVPRHVFFCREAQLPQLGSGKVDKAALRMLAAEKLSHADSVDSGGQGA